MSSESSPPATTWIRVLILAVLVVGGLWWGVRTLALSEPEGAGSGGGGGPRPATVIVVPVQEMEVQETHRVVGTLRAANRSEVAAREDGAIAEVLVNEGDSVQEGAVLVRLDGSRLEAQRAEARARVTIADALVNQREAERIRDEADLRMKKKLYEQEALSESEFLDAERAAKVAASLEKSARDTLAAAQATLELFEVRYRDLEVKAPFDGRVVARDVEPGEWARAGDRLVTLVSSSLEAWLQVPERFAAAAVDRPLTITVTGTGQAVEASGLKPVPESDQRTRIVAMIAPLAEVPPELVAGLSVRADLPVSPVAPRLAVPNDAITRSYSGPGVFRPKVTGEGPPVAERVPVDVLFERSGMTFVKAGDLQPGDLVVTEGNERLFPNTPLLFEPPRAEPELSPES